MNIPIATIVPRNRKAQTWLTVTVITLTLLVAAGVLGYQTFLIDVPSGHMAILVKKTGKNLPTEQEISHSVDQKGIQPEVLGEGRRFYNPWNWDWKVVPQIRVPEGKVGVRIRLYGDNLPAGEILASEPNQKGIVPGVLKPALYPYNAWIRGTEKPYEPYYTEVIELYDTITVPAGYRGVVTKLTGKLPENPNQLLVEKTEKEADQPRGVLDVSEPAGVYYLNPYEKRIQLIDCRSQRYTLSQGGNQMGFPSKDGFWVTLDGIVEFRVKPEKAAEVFVKYNSSTNDDSNLANIREEITEKIILPNARSFCRLRGSDYSGREFILGDTRIQFQKEFHAELKARCESEGIDIIEAVITKIAPPVKIANPVQRRQQANQEEKQYIRQIEQQKAEQQLAIEKELVVQRQEKIKAQQEVIQVVTKAEENQQVKLIEANQKLAVAKVDLAAAQDQAIAITRRGEATAEVIELDNQAEAAGWKRAVEAFGGDGNQYARWVLLQKMAPAYRRLMVSTSDSPLMDIFREFSASSKEPAQPQDPK
ncbi:MAG: SPFH domain-containing protein [Pirellulaceae bacterium]|nr:SPFH domain-containing protein [Pirellulaceae bacterium]